MIHPVGKAEKGVLLRQATIRVAAVTLVMIAAIALATLGFQHTAMEKESRKVMTSLERFYAEKIVLLEQEWQEMAISLHNLLEMHDLFRDPALGWERMRETLALENHPLFPLILVVAPDHRVLFHYATSPVTLPERFVPSGQTGWHEDPRSRVLYRWIAQPFWLGALGQGELLFFVAIENGLLFRNALPFTDLFLLQGDRVAASSLGNLASDPESLRPGSIAADKSRLDQLSIPWGEPASHAPRLVIRHHSTPIFSPMEILLAGITLFLLLALLFWLTLGVWLVRLTRRIATLGWAARGFSRKYHLSSAMRHQLNTVSGAGHDEVTSVVTALLLATDSVEKELQERQRVQAELQKIGHDNRQLLEQAEHYLTYQRVINGLYAISYLKIPLKEQLERALQFIHSVPWLAVQAKGAVFLADPQHRTLHLIAHQGLNPELVYLCQQVAYGHCLCGRAALAGTIVHADCIDDRHDIRFDGMLPHGHYSVPILSGSDLLGVLTFYLEAGQIRNPDEENLLQAIGSTLGNMIERKKLEEALLSQNLLLEEKVAERTRELQAHLTSLRAAQDQLIQSERLAALGGLVAGISHEIKTPVGISFTAVTYQESELTKFLAIQEQGQLRREDLANFLDNLREATHLIKANLKRASDLILSFKQVAVDQTSQERRRFHMRSYLEETIFTLRPKLKKTHHQVTIDCSEEIELDSYPGAISQIISNFVINSLNYAFDDQDEGKITITVALQHDMLHLVYKDNGRGMDRETAKQIYEPFFTTNRNHGGSGLGMHIVYNLVTQRLKGSIDCISAPGEGTEFHIQFPMDG
ncbi:MAG: GAF domain-containing sensor histidine kinase [Magnetococcales bacterium]|nr:GAF domain-containing sensor histidine kinase [Magnetococcales bacterium]